MLISIRRKPVNNNCAAKNNFAIWNRQLILPLLASLTAPQNSYLTFHNVYHILFCGFMFCTLPSVFLWISSYFDMLILCWDKNRIYSIILHYISILAMMSWLWNSLMPVTWLNLSTCLDVDAHVLALWDLSLFLVSLGVKPGWVM